VNDVNFPETNLTVVINS